MPRKAIFPAVRKKGWIFGSRERGSIDKKAARIPQESRRKHTGFTIIFQASQVKSAWHVKANRCIPARMISLTSIPHNRAVIPNRGIPKDTKARRISRAATFWRKVTPVFPRPFRILPIVVDRYRKGQSQDKMTMNLPALASWKTAVPRSLPYRVKIPIQKIPI